MKAVLGIIICALLIGCAKHKKEDWLDQAGSDVINDSIIGGVDSGTATSAAVSGGLFLLEAIIEKVTNSDSDAEQNVTYVPSSVVSSRPIDEQPEPIKFETHFSDERDGNQE